MSTNSPKPSITWWIKLAIAVLSAIAGMITENAINFLGNL